MKNLIMGFRVILLVGIGVFGLAFFSEAIDNCQTKCSADGAGLQYCLSCDTADNNCLTWSSVYACDTGLTCQSGNCVPSNPVGQVTVSLAPVHIIPGVIYNNFLVRVSANDLNYPGRISKICVNSSDININQCQPCLTGQSCSYDFEISSVPTGSWRFYGLAYDSQKQVLATNSILITFIPITQTCSNQCTTMSAWQCPTTNTYQICGDFNNDSCLEWSSAYTCDPGYTCSASGKTCQAVGDNSTTGTLTASKTIALTGENVGFTVKGYDTDGITKVCLLDGEQQTPVCQNSSTYTWNITKQTPGTYFFYGYVYGQRPNGEQVERTTDPFFVQVNFQNPNPVCNNQCAPAEWSCPTSKTYKVCGDLNNDGCYEWSSAYSCDAGYSCSDRQRMCVLQNNNQGTAILSVNKTQAMVGENINLTLTAQDIDGVTQICLITDTYTNAQCKTCSGTSCSNTWATTKTTPGLYSFSGYAITKTPQGGTETINSNIVTVLFSQPGPICSNQCTTMSAWQCPTTNTYQICGDFNNDSCLEWSSAYTCDTGQTCSASLKQCVTQNDNPTSISLTANKNQALVGESVDFTLQASDQDGVEKICFIDQAYSQSPECFNCSGTSCQKIFTKTKQTPGLYVFSGYAVAKNPHGQTNTISATPVSVLFVSPTPLCQNDCAFNGKTECFNYQSIRTCGYYDNDSCLDWSSPVSCGSDVCDPSTNTCLSRWLTVSCYAAPSTAKRGELSWVIAQVAGGVGPYQYSWSGDFSGSEQTVSKTFFTKGTYTANLTVTAGNQTKTANCAVYVSEEIAPYANHPGSGNIWVSNTSPYTGETISINVSGNDEDGIDAIQAYYQNAWHSQSVSGNSAARAWQVVAEYTPGNYQYCGKIVARTMTGQRDVSFTSPRCIEVYVRNR